MLLIIVISTLLFFFFLRIRRPPRYTSTDTLCPDTTRFRACLRRSAPQGIVRGLARASRLRRRSSQRHGRRLSPVRSGADHSRPGTDRRGARRRTPVGRRGHRPPRHPQRRDREETPPCPDPCPARDPKSVL